MDDSSNLATLASSSDLGNLTHVGSNLTHVGSSNLSQV